MRAQDLERERIALDRETKAREHEREMRAQDLERERIEHERRLEESRIKFKSFDTYKRSSAALILPNFKEKTVEHFFEQFEKLATANRWPNEEWVNLIQTKFVGKATEVFTSLSATDMLDYNLVKRNILDAYHVTAEKLRQSFRSITKRFDETYLEFADRKIRAFDKWLRAKDITDFNGLRQLFLIEDFFNNTPNEIKMYFIDKNLTDVLEFAKLADSYQVNLTESKYSLKSPFKGSHNFKPKNRNTFHNPTPNGKAKSNDNKTPPLPPVNTFKPSRFCTYCHGTNHTVDFCFKRKENYRFTPNAVQNMHVSQTIPRPDTRTTSPSNANENASTNRLLPSAPEFVPSSKSQPKPVMNVATNVPLYNNVPMDAKDSIDHFKSFVFDSFCTSFENPNSFINLNSLRDTGCSISLLKRNLLPDDYLKPLNAYAILTGVGSNSISAPLYYLNLSTIFGKDKIVVGLIDELPVQGISLLLGNEYLGARVKPEDPVDLTLERSTSFVSNYNKNPIVMCLPSEPVKLDIETNFPELFPECAVTRSQKQRETADTPTWDLSPNNSNSLTDDQDIDLSETFFADLEVPEKFSRSNLIDKQLADSSLAIVRKEALQFDEINNEDTCYYFKNNLLMRKWTPTSIPASHTWSIKHQIVIPKCYRENILSLAHSIPISGHMGVTKTLERIRNYFYWPGIRSDVTYYCKTCDTCQRVGKPNQSIPVAPLIPIPVLDPPFTRILIDIVGPLPRTHSGNRYLLTLMDLSTRYPEAYALKEISASTVADRIIDFFSHFGICKEIQSDQGSNFMSNLIVDLCKKLNIDKIHSSAYHPQSQGALERYHQTLKTMMRTYCEEHTIDWDKGIPLLLFATREVPVESLGFSPFELVFGHKVRGPLKLMEELILNEEETPINVVNYVHTVQERLIETFNLARDNIKSSQFKMKRWYDSKSRERNFLVGDKVLVLLPIQGQPLKSKFCGPYEVIKKLNDVNYIISTPDRIKETRVCHVNMLKLFHTRNLNVVCCISDNLSDQPIDESFDVDFRINNSELLNKIDDQLNHLNANQHFELKTIICNYRDVFSDSPGLTNKIEHDIDVGDAAPIKQAPYRLNPKKVELVKAEIKSMLEADIIEPSHSEWSSPMILIPKEDGSVRIVVDLRKVNSVSKGDSFPLPRIDSIIDQIGNAKYLSKFDARKGYFQVKMSERAKLISAFASPFGLYQFKRMCYGVKGGPATFQRLMTNLLGQYSSFIVVYIDDICVYSNKWEDHLLHIKILLDIMRDANITLNLGKCVFANAEITFLGFVIGRGRLLPKDRNIKAIKSLPTPTCKRDIQKILGVVGYFRRFVPNFSSISEPLTNLLHKNVKFNWSKECNDAFDLLKAIMCNPPVLKLPNFDKSFKLAIDASGIGIGAVLFQEDENRIDHPICYYSKKLNACQKNYSTIEKEAFALISSVKYFSVYLECGKTVVYTDHNPLTFIHKFKSQNAKLLRWSLILQPFDLEIKHISGKSNIIADTLSRAPITQ